MRAKQLVIPGSTRRTLYPATATRVVTEMKLDGRTEKETHVHEDLIIFLYIFQERLKP